MSVPRSGWLRPLSFFALPLALWAAPALAKEKYQRVVAPEHVIDGLRKVAIIESGDGWNRYFRDAISRDLRSQIGRADGVPEADTGLKTGIVDFAVVKGSATPGGEEVRKLAAGSAAQAVLSVSATGKETAYETYTEDRTAVTYENGEKKERNYTVSCARRDAEAGWTAALYLGSDGSEVMHTSGSGTLSSRDCDEEGDDPLKILTADEMIANVLEGGSKTLVIKFSPYWSPIKVAFAKDKAVSDAVEVADKSGDWATAVEMAQNLLVDDAFNAPAIYLIGFALEMNGRSEEAAILYKFAARMKDDVLYQQAVVRARARAAELVTLERAYGIRPKRAEFSGVEVVLERARKAADIPVAGVPAEIKGTRNKRIPVFRESDPASDVILMVPGDTEVRRISSSNGMVQIQLPDGQEGWVTSDLVK